jgi:hypothetical protein
VQREVAAPDPLELALEALLGRVDHHPGLLAEHEALDLDEAEEAPLGDLPREDLVDLSLVEEGHLVQACRGHPRIIGENPHRAASRC